MICVQKGLEILNFVESSLSDGCSDDRVDLEGVLSVVCF